MMNISKEDKKLEKLKILMPDKTDEQLKVLSEVLDWLKSLGKQENKINENLFELSHITRQINIKRRLEAY